jgi:hypothetical protein
LKESYIESHFIGKLVAEHLEGRWWRMEDPLAFYSARYNLTICCPAGFVTDFASVKRIPVAYLIAGNTGHWEAAIHDPMYRFGLPHRHAADMIFYDAGRVRSAMRENQDLVPRAGRFVRTCLMTGAVVTLGWIDYDPVPGCLDYRHKGRCRRKCKACEHYYPAWSECILIGYVPDILDRHRSGQ